MRRQPGFPQGIYRSTRLPGRVFIALLVQALFEREIRLAMAREKIDILPLYPEERECRAPSTERLLRVFESLQRHRLRQGQHLVQIFQPTLNDLQRQILQLMKLPAEAFTSPT